MFELVLNIFQIVILVLGFFVLIGSSDYPNKKHKLGVYMASFIMIVSSIVSYLLVSLYPFIIGYAFLYLLRSKGFDPYGNQENK